LGYLEAIYKQSRKLVIVCGDSVAGLRERLARSHSRPGAVGRGRKVLSACPRVPSSKLTTARPTPISASTRARLTCLTPLHGRQHDDRSTTLRWSWNSSYLPVLGSTGRPWARCSTVVARGLGLVGVWLPREACSRSCLWSSPGMRQLSRPRLDAMPWCQCSRGGGPTAQRLGVRRDGHGRARVLI
jgi:hypothetical protein